MLIMEIQSFDSNTHLIIYKYKTLGFNQYHVHYSLGLGSLYVQTTVCNARKAHTKVMRLRIGYASKHGSETALDIHRRV